MMQSRETLHNHNARRSVFWPYFTLFVFSADSGNAVTVTWNIGIARSRERNLRGLCLNAELRSGIQAPKNEKFHRRK